MTVASISHELALLAFLLVVVFAGCCLSYAIGADARVRGANGAFWGAFAVAFLPVAVPIYLWYRTRLPTRAVSPGPLERSIGSLGVGGTTAVVVGWLLSPPDPFSSLLYVLPMMVLFVPLAAVVCYTPGWRALTPEFGLSG